MNKLVKYIIESRFNFNVDQIEDIDDENISLSKQQYKSKSMKQEYLENTAFVDLGLPSGTKWAKYNLGVNPESLDKESDWYGNYYKWGETQNITHFNHDIGWRDMDYKFRCYDVGTSKWSSFTKYTCDKDFALHGKPDYLVTLQLEDDAAYQTNHKWRIPTKEQYDELFEYTIHEEVKNYQDIQDLCGLLLTSKMNSKSIFIPYTMVSGIKTKYCLLWTSSLYTKKCDCAYAFEYVKGNLRNFRDLKVRNIFRDTTMNIRPVLVLI